MQEEEHSNFFEHAQDTAEKYIQDRVLWMKLQTAEKASTICSSTASFFIIALAAFFFLFFISLMGGFYFSDVTGSQIKGFGIIALFYLVVFIIIIAFKKKIIELPIANAIVKIFFDKEKEDTI